MANPQQIGINTPKDSVQQIVDAIIDLETSIIAAI
jgi:hypothetical protein